MPATPFSGGPPAVFYTAQAFGSELTVYSGAAGRRIVLTGMIIAASAAVSITFKDGNSGSTVFMVPNVAANTVIPIDLGQGIPLTVANNLRAVSSAAANISGTIFAKDVPA